jgi:hypothetical protein
MPEILRYPIDIGTDNTPAMLFDCHKAHYDPVGDGSAKTTIDWQLAMYIPMGHTNADSMTYVDKASGMGGSLYKMAGKADSLTKMTSIDDLKGAIMPALQSETGKAVVIGAVTANLGAATGAATYIATGAIDEKSKDTQAVINKNPFMTFSDIGLRKWSFSWRFVPQNRQESMASKNIITQFREAMYPTVNGFNLEFPHVFGITFINAAYPRMPEVALTDCSVSYNKNSNSFFMENDEPVSIEMSLSFQELMPINKDHIKLGF